MNHLVVVVVVVVALVSVPTLLLLLRPLRPKHIAYPWDVDRCGTPDVVPQRTDHDKASLLTGI